MESTAYDAVVSGLVLNFIPDVARGIAEMVRAVRPSGTVAAYVWDYAGKIEIMRQFWDVAVDLDPAAHFVDFDDYWVPFAGKQGSALTYLMSLGDEFRRLLKEPSAPPCPSLQTVDRPDCKGVGGTRPTGGRVANWRA